jgi:hypothetical protein
MFLRAACRVAMSNCVRETLAVANPTSVRVGWPMVLIPTFCRVGQGPAGVDIRGCRWLRWRVTARRQEHYRLPKHLVVAKQHAAARLPECAEVERLLHEYGSVDSVVGMCLRFQSVQEQHGTKKKNHIGVF